MDKFLFLNLTDPPLIVCVFKRIYLTQMYMRNRMSYTVLGLFPFILSTHTNDGSCPIGLNKLYIHLAWLQPLHACWEILLLVVVWWY